MRIATANALQPQPQAQVIGALILAITAAPIKTLHDTDRPQEDTLRKELAQSYTKSAGMGRYRHSTAARSFLDKSKRVHRDIGEVYSGCKGLTHVIDQKMAISCIYLRTFKSKDSVLVAQFTVVSIYIEFPVLGKNYAINAIATTAEHLYPFEILLHRGPGVIGRDRVAVHIDEQNPSPLGPPLPYQRRGG